MRGIIVGATGKYPFRNQGWLYMFQQRGVCCGSILCSLRASNGVYQVG
jgi:hypothetical protein